VYVVVTGGARSKFNSFFQTRFANIAVSLLQLHYIAVAVAPQCSIEY